jgi:hypothetical protein
MMSGPSGRKSMNCRKARKLMPLAAGGDAKEKEQLLLSQHVASCTACRSAWREFTGQVRALGSLGRTEPPAGLLEGLADAVVEASRSPSPARPRAAMPRLRFLVPAAAAVLLLAVLGLSGLLREDVDWREPVIPEVSPHRTLSERTGAGPAAVLVVESDADLRPAFPIAAVTEKDADRDVIINIPAERGLDPAREGGYSFVLEEHSASADSTVSLDF